MRRLDDRLGVGGAAELEVEQRHAADRALFDDPGHRAVPALLDENSRHVGGNAEADVDRIAVAQLLRHPPRDHLGDVELRRLERRQRAKDFARNGRLVSRVRRLQLIRRDHDVVDEYARHDDVMGAQRAGRRKPLDLGDDNPAVVAHRERLIERPENAALVLVGKVSPFVGRRRANDRDLRNDARERTAIRRRRIRRARRSAPPPPSRSSRSPRGRDRRTSPSPLWSGRLAASPRPRDECRTGSRTARYRPGSRRR